MLVAKLPLTKDSLPDEGDVLGVIVETIECPGGSCCGETPTEEIGGHSITVANPNCIGH